MSITPYNRPHQRLSLGARLTIWCTVFSFGIILITATVLYVALAKELAKEDDQNMNKKVFVFRALLEQTHPSTWSELKEELKEVWRPAQLEEVYIRLIREKKGLVFGETPGIAQELPLNKFPAPFFDEKHFTVGKVMYGVNGKKFRVISARFASGKFANRPWIMQIAMDQTSDEIFLADYRQKFLILLIFSVLPCAFTGYFIAKKSLKPIAEISETAKKIHSSTLNQRFEIKKWPAELSELVNTFNEMLDRLEDAFSRIAQFSNDIAHELRTPINNLRGEAEVALSKLRTPLEYQEVLSSCLEESARLAKMVDSLLFIARAEQPHKQISTDVLNIRNELEAIREFYEAITLEAGVSIKVVAENDLTAKVEKTLFRRAISNLVDNALTYTPKGGSISITAWRNLGFFYLRVSDTGCGIPQEHLPHVFERFYRADQVRTSDTGRLGLGLPLVKSIANLHGGRVELMSNAVQGTRVTLIFPSEEPVEKTPSLATQQAALI